MGLILDLGQALFPLYDIQSTILYVDHDLEVISFQLDCITITQGIVPIALQQKDEGLGRITREKQGKQFLPQDQFFQIYTAVVGTRTAGTDHFDFGIVKSDRYPRFTR